MSYTATLVLLFQNPPISQPISTRRVLARQPRSSGGCGMRAHGAVSGEAFGTGEHIRLSFATARKSDRAWNARRSGSRRCMRMHFDWKRLSSEREDDLLVRCPAHAKPDQNAG